MQNILNISDLDSHTKCSGADDRLYLRPRFSKTSQNLLVVFWRHLGMVDVKHTDVRYWFSIMLPVSWDICQVLSQKTALLDGPEKKKC